MYARLIRWGFTRFYREFAWTYDTVAALVSAGYWRAWALIALPELHGRVLELGCGTGNLQLALAQRPASALAFGVDLSRQMLRHTRRKAARAGAVVQLAQASALELPFSTASFHMVVATFPSEYIAAPATLAEVRRVLVAGGQLLIILGAQLSGDGLYERLIDVAYRITLQSSSRATRQPPPQLPSAVAATPPSSMLIHGLKQELGCLGFAVQDQWVPAPGGQVYMIRAETAECRQELPKS